MLFAKVQLKDGGSFNGTSHRNEVENHRVQWDEDFNFSCKMYASVSTGVLEPCWCKISIRKETKGGRSCTKLGYVKINLAEYAGAGVRQRKYLLESYNENKHKPDNSLVKVKVYLRLTSGDILFKAPETKVHVWEMGDEDEGFQDWLSMYSRGSENTPRASTGSTMSFVSIGGGTWSSHGGSAGNLKSHDSFGDISKGGGDRGGGEEDDRESGSEETIVDHTSSQTTVETTNTNSTITGQTGQTSMLTGDITENTIVRTKSYSTSNIAVSTSNNSITIEAPILEETSLPTTDPMHTLLNPFQCTENQRPSIKAEPQSGSYKDLRHSPVLRKESQLRVPPSISSRRGKAGPSVQSSHVTALPGSSRSHHRQASMGIFHHSPSPLSLGHKRHSSFSTISPELSSESISLHSTKTRGTTLSTLEYSRRNTETVVNDLIKCHDLTPASDDESETNLKLYVDKHSGGLTIAGHDLDRSRFKQIDVHSLSLDLKPKPRRKHRQRELMTSGSLTQRPKSMELHSHSSDTSTN